MMLRWGNATTGTMADPKKTTFGYAASTDHPDSVNQAAPSFPPTSLMFQTYQFISHGATEPEVGLEAGQRNMLLYLNMTRHKRFPIERFLDYSGNHVPSTIDGSMIIEKDIFWNSYLVRQDLPLLLNVLNQVTYAWVRDVWVHYNGFQTSWGATYGVGPSGYTGGNRNFFTWEAVDNLKWEWKKNYHERAHHGWGNAFSGEYEMWCKSYFKCQQNGQNC